VNKQVESFSAVGKIACSRAILEGERRYCGNESEVRSGAPVELTSRDKLSLLLDPRTVNCRHLEGREWLMKDCKDDLEELYIQYGLRSHAYVAETSTSANVSTSHHEGSTPSSEAAASSVGAEQAQKCMWSSDEDEEPFGEESFVDKVAEAAAAEAALRMSLKEEFIRCFRNYRKVAEKVDWRQLNDELCLGLKLPGAGVIDLMDLWYADMGKVMKHLYVKVAGSKSQFGFLPKMAIFSRGSIGALGASSFCERINSAANLTVTTGNSLLSTKEINMVVVLRVNRAYMSYMREHYPHVSRQHFKMTVLKLSDNKCDENDE